MAAPGDAIGDGVGTYVLWLQLGRDREIAVGRLGRFHFAPGVYAYVGSALGPGGIAVRIARHLRRRTSLHWHVDYLRAEAQPVGVWWATGDRRRECDWTAALVRMPGAVFPVAGFGASDCGCSTHLVRFPTLPAVADFAHAVDQPVMEVCIE